MKLLMDAQDVFTDPLLCLYPLCHSPKNSDGNPFLASVAALFLPFVFVSLGSTTAASTVL